MATEDVKSIIVYLRTLEPVEHKVPESDPDFPMSLIMRTLPKPPDPMDKPSRTDKLEYGRYLANIGGCIKCHTPAEKGQPIEEMAFAGGFEFHLKTGGYVYSSNITPDEETGIGNWSEKDFVGKFKSYASAKAKNILVRKGEFNTPMPWTMYAGMKKEDLKAIYAFLQSLDPIKNKVVKFRKEEEATGS